MGRRAKGKRMSELILQPIACSRPFRPLEQLSENIQVWTEKRVCPSAVVTALGYLADRDLKPFEERDIVNWMQDGAIGRTPIEGEQV